MRREGPVIVELASTENRLPYDAASIIISSGLEAVRRNPSMYIGSTGIAGLHQLVFELVDNAVDEATAGYGADLTVCLHEDGSCSVTDNGRGIPTGTHPEAGRPACEVVLTTLHSGGKFEGSFYATPAGLHGVGMACVNGLSMSLRLDVWDGTSHFRQDFECGKPIADLEVLESTGRTGTRIQFRPDATIFDSTEFAPSLIAERLEEIAFLHPALRIALTDERAGTIQSFSGDGGIRAFLDNRGRDAVTVHPEPIMVTARSGPMSAEVAFRWTEGYAEEIWSYVNTLRTSYGGEHVDGLRAGWPMPSTGTRSPTGCSARLAGRHRQARPSRPSTSWKG